MPVLDIEGLYKQVEEASTLPTLKEADAMNGIFSAWDEALRGKPCKE